MKKDTSRIKCEDSISKRDWSEHYDEIIEAVQAEIEMGYLDWDYTIKDDGVYIWIWEKGK